MICRLRRYYIVLRLLQNGRRDAWKIAALTGHNWITFTRIADTELQQCKNCKTVWAILHL